MATDVKIKDTFPAVEYSPLAPDIGTYFEEREVNGVLYLTANAQFSDASMQWDFVVHGTPAYATSSNADGTTSHYMVPVGTAPWTSWYQLGNGQQGIYNVKDFGATGDGSTPDDTAIQKANDIAVGLGGGCIYVPEGKYVLGASINLGSTNPDYAQVPISIRGDGPDRSKFYAQDDINGGLSILMVTNANNGDSTSVVQYNIYVENLGFDANAPGNPLQGTSDFRGPIFLKQVQNCGVRNCIIVNSSNHGILISGTGSQDWPVASPLNFEVIGNHINLNYNPDPMKEPGTTGKFPIRVEGAMYGVVQGNTIGELCVTSTNDAIDMPGSSVVECCDNYIMNCTDGIGSNACADVLIANNRIIGPIDGYGISSFSSGGSDNGASGVYRMSILGNTIVNPGKSAIRVSCPEGGPSPTPTDSTVAGNVIILGSNSGPYGIHIESNYSAVLGNTVDLGGTSQTGIAIDSTFAYDPGEGQTGNNNVTVTGNSVLNGGSSAVGISFVIHNEIAGSSLCTNCVATDNNVFNINTPLTPDFNGMINCTVRNNLGINPWMSSVTTPTLPSSGSPVPNQYPFDIWVTIAKGKNVTVSINGFPSGVSDGSILLPAGTANWITVSYTKAPDWTWLAY